MITKCELCPRKCAKDRSIETGFCNATDQLKVARAALHGWEEPCISGTNGSGTVFFSGCVLQCCFCQNFSISAKQVGKEISVERLAEIFLELQHQKAHNINLVNPTHYVLQIMKALTIAKPKLKIPVIYNSGGFERIETLRLLEGYIDVYLPDLKYMDDERANRYSNARGYFEAASQAILFMFEQVGKVQFDENNLIKRGVIVRHMVMPKGLDDSINIMTWLANHLPKDDFLVSVMSQYTPCYKSHEYREINRRLFSYEYHKVIDKVHELSLNGYLQEKSAAKEEYTPPFDLFGV